MIKAARRAGKSLVKDFREVENLQVSAKGPGDFVSKADREAERIIKEELMGGRPTYGWLGEETGATAGQDPTRRWIVDPLDGTTNFAHGFPVYNVTLALEHKGELIAERTFEAPLAYNAATSALEDTASPPSSSTRSATQHGGGAATASGGACPTSHGRPVSNRSWCRAGQASSTVHIGLPGFLGVSIAPSSTGSGATVSSVLAGRPAAAAGIHAGDVITAWGRLGYPRRARRLWEAAGVISREGWPDDLATLQVLGRSVLGQDLGPRASATP